ncbi:MAG: amino acid permease [Solirubrobacteraceae bacterium]
MSGGDDRPLIADPSSTGEQPAVDPGVRESGLPAWRRAVGSPAVFAATYTALGGSLYLLLGPIAGAALGATPAVMLAAGLLFALATMTYVEGASLHPERGGAAMFARHGLDESWSFLAAWALLLDAVLLIAASVLAATNYLEAVWPATSGGATELVVAGLILAFVTVLTLRGRPFGPFATPGRLAVVVTVDVLLQILVVVLGLVLLADPDLLTDTITLAAAGDVEGILFGLGAAMIVVTGLEAATGLAGELRIGRAGLRRLSFALPAAMLLIYPAVAVVGLVALPVQDGTTGLAERWVDAPVLGIVEQFHGDVARDALSVVVGVVATATLVGMALGALRSTSRITSQMARYRQIPVRLGRLHPRYGTPWLVIGAAALTAAGLVALRDMDALVGTMAYGVMLAVTIAHVSVVRLRFTEPDLDRPYRIPLNVRIGKASVPLPALVGAILSGLVWLSIVVSHPEARVVGLAWTAIGLVGYVAYRRSRDLPVRGRVAVPETALTQQETVREWGSILVPLIGSGLDDDLIQTAGRLAGGVDETDPDEEAAVIEAVWIHVVPVAKAIDAPISDARRDAARAALARARAVGEEYDGVRVATSAVRARSRGRAIVEEAERRGCEAIVMVAPPSGTRSSTGRSAAILGAKGGRGDVLGAVGRYVIDHAGCQVLLTAPEVDESDALLRGEREMLDAEARAAEADELDDDEEWLERLDRGG